MVMKNKKKNNEIQEGNAEKTRNYEEEVKNND